MSRSVLARNRLALHCPHAAGAALSSRASDAGRRDLLTVERSMRLFEETVMPRVSAERRCLVVAQDRRSGF
jgi:hypothetical protein